MQGFLSAHVCAAICWVSTAFMQLIICSSAQHLSCRCDEDLHLSCLGAYAGSQSALDNGLLPRTRPKLGRTSTLQESPLQNVHITSRMCFARCSHPPDMLQKYRFCLASCAADNQSASNRSPLPSNSPDTRVKRPIAEDKILRQVCCAADLMDPALPHVQQARRLIADLEMPAQPIQNHAGLHQEAAATLNSDQQMAVQRCGQLGWGSMPCVLVQPEAAPNPLLSSVTCLSTSETFLMCHVHVRSY